VPLGVVDVGSNTVRLLVADQGRTLLSEREMLHLGAHIERTGEIPPEKLAEAASVVGRFAEDARAFGAHVAVLIASPGRQARNGDELLRLLAGASGCPTRILSAEEEGRLAFAGALACVNVPARRRVAVVDVGGGSAQLIVGSRRDGAIWTRSIDLGSQRLTSRLLADDPPGRRALRAAVAEVERCLEGFDPPVPRTAIAVGGSARALKRIAGSPLRSGAIEEALAMLASTPAAALARRHGLAPERAKTLPAGAVILSSFQRLLDCPLKVVRAGLREGALVALAADEAAAAA
jgi:exopolyphosphatase/guanosine-5'-triphosphate,3'-diphosphate pyrophosphatase